MNGHKAFKEIPNCQIEGNAYTTVRANPLTMLELNAWAFYNGNIPMGKEEITAKPHTFLNLMASM